MRWRSKPTETSGRTHDSFGFESTAQLARALNDFERHYNTIAKPFNWKFTRDDLAALLIRLADHEPQLQLAA